MKQPSNKILILCAFCLFAGTATLGAQKPKVAGSKKPKPIGYSDTPFLPDSKWRVHDAERPRPKVVAPGTSSSPASPGRPPSDAIVLFAGKDLSQWTDKGGEGDAGWKVENGYAEVNRTGAIRTKKEFGDCQLHVEWASPAVPKGNSQGRGNSGVILMGKYEVQVLDSYDNVSYADGQAASLYGQKPPAVNVCRKPGEWQSYDIIFTAPRFVDGKLVSSAYFTVIHNGVLVHNHVELLGPTRHKKVSSYEPHAPKGALTLQDHGNPVRYRNIWIRPLGGEQE